MRVLLQSLKRRQQPVQAPPIGAAARMQACIAGTVAVLVQPMVVPGPTPPTQLPQLGILPDGGRLRGR